MRKKPELLRDKVKIIKGKKYFNTPLDENNKPYWIPIVVKDKSYLLGFINAYHFICDVRGYEGDKIELEMALGSDRFNDVLTDGSRIKNLNREQLKKKIKKIYFDNETNNHPENSEGILNQYYLSFSCNCGMFFAFKEENEIPEEDFKCVTCGRTLISYVHENDDYFNFDGIVGDVDKIIEEINNER